MRTALFVFAIAAGVAAMGPSAHAQNFPWCAYYSGGGFGGTNCGFATLGQCRAAVSGVGGYCAHNTQYRGRTGYRPY